MLATRFTVLVVLSSLLIGLGPLLAPTAQAAPPGGVSGIEIDYDPSYPENETQRELRKEQCRKVIDQIEFNKSTVGWMMLKVFGGQTNLELEAVLILPCLHFTRSGSCRQHLGSVVGRGRTRFAS